MNILNNYAGVGGNRKLWKDCKVTAVESDPEIARIYRKNYPEDVVVIGDAHDFLLKHYEEFDFIWDSPPCQTHSDIRRMGVAIGQNEAVFPDMNLWQEIIFLKHNYSGKWIVENVKPYYEPFVQPSIQLDRHLIWSNINITPKEFEKDNKIKSIVSNTKHYGFDLSGENIKHRKDQILRNCVNPEIGLWVLEHARGIIREESQEQLSFLRKTAQNTALNTANAEIPQGGKSGCPK